MKNVKRPALLAAFVGLAAGILLIAGVWSWITPVPPATQSDTTATPTPGGKPLPK